MKNAGLLLVLVVLLSFDLFAQQVTGVVRDVSGSAMVGATLRNLSTQINQTKGEPRGLIKDLRFS